MFENHVGKTGVGVWTNTTFDVSNLGQVVEVVVGSANGTSL